MLCERLDLPTHAWIPNLDPNPSYSHGSLID